MKTVSSCMKREVISISKDMTAREAIATCIRYHIGTLPVVDERGILIGTVRLADLIGLGMPDFLQFLDRLEFIHTFGSLEIHKPDPVLLNKPVTEIMNPPIIVKEDAGLLRASALLHKHQLMDVLVVDHENRLVGVASRVDIGVALMKDWIDIP